MSHAEPALGIRLLAASDIDAGLLTPVFTGSRMILEFRGHQWGCEHADLCESGQMDRPRHPELQGLAQPRSRFHQARREPGRQGTWTAGEYDIVAVTEFPDDEAGMAAALRVGSLGSVRTTTMRAFGADEMGSIITKAG